jgi:protein O-GlcNAc transferase
VRPQGLFALRPAPIQMFHQEFLGTSGANYVDYHVSDVHTSPPEKDYLYTEKLIYLPNHFFSKGHAVMPEIAPPRLKYDKAIIPYKTGTGSPQENRCLSRPINNTDVSFVFCNFHKFLKVSSMT